MTSQSGGNLIQGNNARPCKTNLNVATWNIEGLTDEKLVELQEYMFREQIDIICLQELHKTTPECCTTDAGYMLIVSASEGEDSSSAGVGFLVAPWIRRSVINFKQEGSRMAALRLRVRGGKLTLITAYAPHSGYSFAVRQKFFQDLGHFFSSFPSHGLRLVYGDLNAKLYHRAVGEEEIVGPYVFESPVAALTPDMNRQLLIEMCEANQLAIGNTFFNLPAEKLITNYNVGYSLDSPISPSSRSQIDFVLIDRSSMEKLVHAESHILEPLATHHYILTSALKADVPLQPQSPSPGCRNFQVLRDPVQACRFSTAFADQMEVITEIAEGLDTNLDMKYAMISDAFHAASAACVPERPVEPRRPWISQGTLALIHERLAARRSGAHDRERLLTKRIKKNIKNDRSQWLDDALANGSWDEVRKLRRGKKLQQGGLKNSQGVVTGVEQRAETLASYLESTQWAEKLCPGSAYVDHLGEELAVNTDRITYDELSSAAKKLKYGKACGTDGIPAECWRAVLDHDSHASRWIVEFVNELMREERVPSQWHDSRVAAVYKKGDPTEASNYRPISLLQIGYKLFAQVLLQRLKDAGAEKRIWSTQFGFRTKVGTAEALFVARRQIDQAWMMKSGETFMLALDWAKAFDSISPAALRISLKRFGLPDRLLSIVEAIYSDRRFTVRDSGRESSNKSQKFGVSQGCPLSPFLFSILMTTLIHDARRKLVEQGWQLSHDRACHELLYADDTLIIDSSKELVHAYMMAISEIGKSLGLSLNWDKVELLTLRTDGDIRAPDGQPIKKKQSIKYLGSTLASDGRIHHELSRRLGAAAADFKVLQRLWNHSTLNATRKLRIFDACVLSKLTYGLHVTWLNQAERRRLDGFHCRCLRRIMKIPAAFYSRVSNSDVFQRAGARPATTILLEHQLLFLHKIVNLRGDDPLRKSVFMPGCLQHYRPAGARRVGRPRANWGEAVWRAAVEMTGNEHVLSQFLNGRASAWRSEVRRHLA